MIKTTIIHLTLIACIISMIVLGCYGDAYSAVSSFSDVQKAHYNFLCNVGFYLAIIFIVIDIVIIGIQGAYKEYGE